MEMLCIGSTGTVDHDRFIHHLDHSINRPIRKCLYIPGMIYIIPIPPGDTDHTDHADHADQGFTYPKISSHEIGSCADLCMIC